MDRDTFSHIRLWCPRPFGTYSQNKPRGGASSLGKAEAAGRMSSEAGLGEDQEDTGTENMPPDPAPPPSPPALPTPAAPTPNAPTEDSRVLLDTWYVIKPGNTKEKIAYFVAHQCSGMGLPRSSAVKVKGNWTTDCTKAKRRRRCSSYDPPAQTRSSPPHSVVSPSEDGLGVGDADLLSVAEMVALVEQRTALALQGIVVQRPTSPALEPAPLVATPSSTPVFEQQQQESHHVARAIAHFESQQQQLEGALLGNKGPHRRGEVRIAFRVSSLDCRSQSEPAGRPSCMYMSCGGPGGHKGARAKEKITCDLYQLVSPSSREPQGENLNERPSPSAGDIPQDGGTGEKKPASCERVTGFHVEVVVTGAVDQCVFYGKDSTETVQEETVCFSMSPAVSSEAGEDPPPGQLFFLQSEEEAAAGAGSRRLPESTAATGATERPDSPLADGDADRSLCRLYRHVSHDFLEIRFQIQRLLEPRQYMLQLPDHILVHIFSHLPTRALAALKCTCHDFKALIEMYGVRATDSRWNQDPLYRDDPCKQCKRQYARGDVSLCRWHPKPYHHDLPYGRSYWMCCRRTDKDTPGCRVGLHDNNWVQPCELVQTRARRDDGR